MRVITAGQLRARLGEALDRASAGERIVIERDHRRVAAIVPIEDAQQLEGRSGEAIGRKHAAIARIAERARRMRARGPNHDLSAYDAQYLVLAEAAAGRAILIDGASRIPEHDASEASPVRHAGPDWPRWPGAAAHLEELREEAVRDLETLRRTGARSSFGQAAVAARDSAR